MGKATLAASVTKTKSHFEGTAGQELWVAPQSAKGPQLVHKRPPRANVEILVLAGQTMFANDATHYQTPVGSSSCTTTFDLATSLNLLRCVNIGGSDWLPRLRGAVGGPDRSHGGGWFSSSPRSKASSASVAGPSDAGCSSSTGTSGLVGVSLMVPPRVVRRPDSLRET